MKNIGAAIRADNTSRMQLEIPIPETSDLFTGNTRLLYSQKRLKSLAEEAAIKKRIQAEKERFLKEAEEEKKARFDYPPLICLLP